MTIDAVSTTPAVAVPDVGTLVEYGLDSFGRQPAEYRVSAWMRAAPTPVFDADDYLDGILFEACQEVRDASDGKKKRMQFCLREEATHLSLRGIAGAIAPITMCKVIGGVDWSLEVFDAQRKRAESLGRTHDMLF